MGLKVPLFREKNKNLTENLKRSMLNYVKGLQETGINQDPGLENQIKLTESGFPVLPDPVGWRTARKVDLELLTRTYLSQHYSMFHSEFEADAYILRRISQ